MVKTYFYNIRNIGRRILYFPIDSIEMVTKYSSDINNMYETLLFLIKFGKHCDEFPKI